MIELIEKNMFDCFWVKTFGVECLGCGFQRSIIFLLEGNLKDSIIVYPALIPSIILILYLFLHLIFRFKNGHNWIIMIFVTTISIMIINYIIKLI